MQLMEREFPWNQEVSPSHLHLKLIKIPYWLFRLFFNAACLGTCTIPGYTIKEEEQENKRIEKTVL